MRKGIHSFNNRVYKLLKNKSVIQLIRPLKRNIYKLKIYNLKKNA